MGEKLGYTTSMDGIRAKEGIAPGALGTDMAFTEVGVKYDEFADMVGLAKSSDSEYDGGGGFAGG
jgi:hypothetical protein